MLFLYPHFIGVSRGDDIMNMVSLSRLTGNLLACSFPVSFLKIEV